MFEYDRYEKQIEGPHNWSLRHNENKIHVGYEVVEAAYMLETVRKR